MSKAWPIVRLGEVLTPVRREESVDPLREYRLLGVRLDGNGPFLRESVTGAQTAAAKLYRVAEGDFIYSRLFACRGALGVIGKELNGCYVSGEFPTFVAVPDLVDVQFVRYWFRLRTVIARVDADCSGSTPLTRNRFNERFFVALEMPLPPLAEQRRVIARIEELAGQIQEARDARRAARESADALMGSATSRAFDELSRLPAAPLRELGQSGENPIQTGPFGAQLHASEFVAEGVPVLNVGNVWPEGLRLDQLDRVLPEKARQLQRYSLRRGDLLFARSGATLGKVCIVPNECDGWLMTGHLFRVRFDATRVFNQFAFAGLRHARSVQEQVFGQVRGATRPGFNTTLLGNVHLPLPSLEIQEAVVARLNAIQTQADALRAAQEESDAELHALLPAILDRAFKGELV